MSHCEDAEHTMAGVAACIGDWCPDLGLGLFTGNLDGVVRISYSEKRFNPKTEMTEFIGNDENYISDHNGVNIEIDTSRHDRPNARFNIITHNLEGLCNRNDTGKMARFQFIKNHLSDYFRAYIKAGTVMLIQELALQLHKKDAAKQRVLLTLNMDMVLGELRKLNPDLVGVTDGYTGCIIYDEKKWSVEKEVNINRTGSDKYSNAYLMRFIPYPKLMIWMVNIHLKAYGSSVKSQDIVNNSHIYELANILEGVLVSNPEKYPVYLCGDFNNGTVKAKLIMKAAMLVAIGYQLFYEDPYAGSVPVPVPVPLTNEQQATLFDALRE
jgi:hypothetical protein